MEERQTQYAVQAGQACLTIDRPKQRNALSAQAMRELLEGIDRAEADAAVRVIVVTGAGDKAFCSGGDLSSLSADGPLAGHERVRLYATLLRRFSEVRKPSIARVNGYVLAGGVGLMLACDLVVATETAELGTPEIDVGLFPMMVMALLQRHIGRKRALELVMTGERISARTALEWGMLNRVVPAAELDATVQQIAEKLAGKSQAILGLGRRAFFTAEDVPLAQSLEYLGSQLSLNVLTADAAEGVAAFVEKRKPRWADR